MCSSKFWLFVRRRMSRRDPLGLVEEARSTSSGQSRHTRIETLIAPLGREQQDHRRSPYKKLLTFSALFHTPLSYSSSACLGALSAQVSSTEICNMAIPWRFVIRCVWTAASPITGKRANVGRAKCCKCSRHHVLQQRYRRSATPPTRSPTCSELPCS